MLTKKEALEKTVHMWRWIAEECEKQKRTINEEEYFKYCGETNYPKANCYLCEYRHQNRLSSCLIEKWNNLYNYRWSGCLDYEFGDYYDSFDDNDYQMCAKAANAVADLAEMELKKLWRCEA